MSIGKKSLFKNVASLSIMQISNYVFPLIYIPVISRIIGPEKFGVINYAMAFISYFTLLISYGFDFTATRRISKDPLNVELRRKVFNEVFSAQCLFFVISFFLFLICLFTVPPLAAEKKVAIFSFLFCIGVVLTQNWLFQAMQDLPKIAILSFVSKLLFTLTIFCFVRKREDYIWQPLLTSTIQILISIISFLWAYKRYNLYFKFIPLIKILLLLWEERIVFFSTVVISLYTTTNIVILGLMENETQVGYYTAADRLIAVGSSVINIPLSQALFPYIGFAFSEGREKGIKAVQNILPIIVLFTGITSLGMIIIGPTILIWFYGKAFEQSIPVFRIITILPFIIALSNVFGIQIMLNLKMDVLFFKITFIGAILGICLNLFMVHFLGYIGTAWNCIIVESYITIAMYIVLVKKGLNPFNVNNFKFKTIKVQIQLVTKKLKK